MAKVLVIDDSRFSRNMAARALSGAGHEVFEADNGAVGLESVQQHTPDCIILDLLMPVVDGPQFLERLRATGSDTPVVVVSADIQDGSRALCTALTISGFLNKPVHAEALLPAVERALGEHREKTSCR